MTLSAPSAARVGSDWLDTDPSAPPVVARVLDLPPDTQESSAPLSEPQGPHEASPAPDALRLCAALGAPRLEYREIVARERAERLAAQAVMMGWRVISPDPARKAHRTPTVIERPLTVAILGLARGVGRTTVAANLAATLSQRFARTVAIGLDPRNDLGPYFGAEQSHLGLINHTTTLSRLQSIKNGTVCVPFGDAAASSTRDVEEWLSAEPRWLEERLLPMALNVPEVWVLDTPADDGPLLAGAVALADLRIIVTSSDPDAMHMAARLDESLCAEAKRAQHLPPLLVLNRFDSRRELDRAAQATLGQHWGPRLAPVALHEDLVDLDGTSRRTLVVHRAPHSQLSADFVALGDWLCAQKLRPVRDRSRVVCG